MLVRYLDLDLLINGIMDLILLLLTARLLHLSTSFKRLAAGVFLGEISVVLSAYAPASVILDASKILTPFAMVGISFQSAGRRAYLKRLLLFWILSAGLGGFIYALWGWAQFDGLNSGLLLLRVESFWMLPLAAVLWWGSQTLWQNWLARTIQLKPALYDIVISLGVENRTLRVRALLDTGNQLRDPITGTPVLLVEEQAAAAALPEELQNVLHAPWRDLVDPWPWLWNENPSWMKTVVFIPYQARKCPVDIFARSGYLRRILIR